MGAEVSFRRFIAKEGLLCLDLGARVTETIDARIVAQKEELELKERLAEACRILAMEGQGDLAMGHMSARLLGADRFWMKPRGLGLEEVTPEDLVLLDLEGQQIGGQRRAHMECPLHGDIYRARPDVVAIVHTHPPHAVAFGATDFRLRPVSHEGVHFPNLPRFAETTDIIITRELGQAVARSLGQERAVLLKNHGLVTVGPSIAAACLLAIFLERACRIQLVAHAAGTFGWTPDDEVEPKRVHVFNPGNMHDFYEYLRRKVKRWNGVPL